MLNKKSSHTDSQSIYLCSMLRVNISVGNRFDFVSIGTNELMIGLFGLIISLWTASIQKHVNIGFAVHTVAN